jgi:NADPH:quinone reductase-like Zn-dependent oxidoreductase
MSLRRTPVRVVMDSPGLLDDVVLRPMERLAPGPNEVEIRVLAVGLNLREVLRALGVYPSEATDEIEREPASRSMAFDGDCAGVVVAKGKGVPEFDVGDEVFGYGEGVFSSFVNVPAFRLVPKPPHLSFAQAATIPTAFVTAYYALHHLARIQPGERVVIQAAAGGVGLAAVQLSQRIGAEIFATAGREQKRSYLRALGLPHVLDSRSLCFAQEVLQATDGKGVDVVLNSLAGKFLAAGLSVLAPFGRFLEIGKRDIHEDRPVGLRAFRNNISFFAIDLEQFSPSLVERMTRAITRHFEDGKLAPLPYQSFPAGDVVAAFRYLRSAKHIGKVVVSFADDG